MMLRLAALGAMTAMLAACGGGGSSAVPASPTAPTPAPTATPTTAPTLAPQGNLPATQSIGGAPGWANAVTSHTLYFLDVDTATGGTCTAACLTVWPVYAPATGSVASGNMTIVTRSDGTGQQWAYQGHPLYMYAGDNAADQTNGDGIPDFGGHWHVARPAAAATPAPGSSAPPCSGNYC